MLLVEISLSGAVTEVVRNAFVVPRDVVNVRSESEGEKDESERSDECVR